MERLMKCFEIFLKYEPSCDVAAEHDILYLGAAHPTEMTKKELETLEDSGCFWDEEHECWCAFC
jgi:hypothetical protein